MAGPLADINGFKCCWFPYTGRFTTLSKPMKYWILLPDDYNAETEYPLVVLLQGGKIAYIVDGAATYSDGAMNLYSTPTATGGTCQIWGTSQTSIYENYKAVVIMPDTSDCAEWLESTALSVNDSSLSTSEELIYKMRCYGARYDGLEPLKQLIESLIDGDTVFYSTDACVPEAVQAGLVHPVIDTDKIYAVGYSYGGGAVWRLLQKMRNTFAAAVVGAGWPIGNPYQDYYNSSRQSFLGEVIRAQVRRVLNIPIVFHAGTLDTMWTQSLAGLEKAYSDIEEETESSRVSHFIGLAGGEHNSGWYGFSDVGKLFDTTNHEIQNFTEEAGENKSSVLDWMWSKSKQDYGIDPHPNEATTDKFIYYDYDIDLSDFGDFKMANRDIYNFADLLAVQPEDVCVLKNDIAFPTTAHNAALAYSYQDFVVYSGSTYFCSVLEGIEAEAWNAEHWTLAWGSTGWPGICTTAETAFTGSFDGGNHTISGLTSSHANYMGLFIYTGNGASIKNLKLTSVSLVSSTASKWVGGIAASLTGTSIYNCHISGTITGLTTIGAFAATVSAGTAGASIKRCSSSCAVTVNLSSPTVRLGGLVSAFGSGCIIDSCMMTGNVIKQGANGVIGGLIGTGTLSIIKNCVMTGNVTGGGGNYTAAGICAYGSSGTGTVTNCLFLGSVDGAPAAYRYGIAKAGDVTITNSYYDETVAGALTDTATAGKTTADLKARATFPSTWDFKNTWMMLQLGLLSGYPTLSWPYNLSTSSSSGVFGGSRIY